MVLYFIILITQSFADIGCEKFDGAAYDSCVLSSNKSNAVTIKEEDVDKTEETNCSKYRDAKAMKSCLEKAHKSASDRAAIREERERIEPPKPIADKTESCGDESVYASCQSAHSKAQEVVQDPNRDGDAKKAAVATCMAACTRVTPSVSAKIRSCPMDKIKRINTLFAINHPTCGANVQWKDNCKDYLVPGCERDLKGIEADLLNGGTGDTKTCDGKSCTATKKIAGDISLVAVTPDGKMQSVPSMYYTDSTGAKYTSLEDARNGDLFGVDLGDNSNNAEVALISGTDRAERRMESGALAAVDPVVAPLNSVPAVTPEKQTAAPDDISPATQTANPANTTNSFPTQPQTAPQAVSLASNSFAGTGFTGGTGIEGITRNDYQQSANTDDSSSSRFPSNLDGEIASGSGGSDGITGGGNSGGFAPLGSAKQGGLSEAVGGGATGSNFSSFGNGSMGRNTGGNDLRVASTNKVISDNPQLTSPFNGYYKAPGQISHGGGKIPKAANNTINGKRGSAKAKSKVRDCNGNFICIAKYLGGGKAGSFRKRSRGAREIASLKTHPSNPEIGAGYEHILLRVEKIHNNMAIDSDGNLDGIK